MKAVILPMTRATVLLWLLVFAANNGVQAANTELASPAQQTILLELYTSEGCSSCPPADRWLSQFKTDTRLWHQVVPVAFHVDYWNHLGWRDRFAKPAYSQRQRDYLRHRYLRGIYTPGMVLNGREWRSWFGLRQLPQPADTEVGILKATIGDTHATIEFTPSQAIQEPLNLNLAFLGFDQSTAVSAGENHGKKLVHDFVVLDWRQYPQSSLDDHHRWVLEDLPTIQPTQATGIALWVTTLNDPTPLQATGGWLRP